MRYVDGNQGARGRRVLRSARGYLGSAAVATGFLAVLTARAVLYGAAAPLRPPWSFGALIAFTVVYALGLGAALPLW